MYLYSILYNNIYKYTIIYLCSNNKKLKIKSFITLCLTIINLIIVLCTKSKIIYNKNKKFKNKLINS